MVDKVRLVNDPILRKVTTTVTEFGSSLEELLVRMEKTMTTERGIGLAANQIGVDQRVFILRDAETYREFINPEIIEENDLVVFEGEGCLSIPGVTASTERYKKIKVKFQTKDGDFKEEEFSEMNAYAIQHELDHLNGKLYVDQFGPVKKDMLLSKHRKFLRLKERQR